MKATAAFVSSVQDDSVVCIDLMTVLPRSDYKQLHIRRAAFAMAREWGKKILRLPSHASQMPRLLEANWTCFGGRFPANALIVRDLLPRRGLQVRRG
jgi:hypothetical protein